MRLTYGAQTVAMKESHLMRRHLLGVVAPYHGKTGTMINPALARLPSTHVRYTAANAEVYDQINVGVMSRHMCHGITSAS